MPHTEIAQLKLQVALSCNTDCKTSTVLDIYSADFRSIYFPILFTNFCLYFS